MDAHTLPASPLAGLQSVELGPADAPRLQRFFEANPDYFLRVLGEPAGPAEGADEIAAGPPADWGFTKKWLIGYADAAGTLAAMANITTDLLAPGVWHVGLFIVDAARRGSGDARTLYLGLEAWARACGAQWMRLGVVQGNTPAERFWAAQGYVEVRVREGQQMGRRLNTIRVMVKPLAGGRIDDYLGLVPRDRPEPPAGPPAP